MTLTKDDVRIYTAKCRDGVQFTDCELRRHPSSRAIRLVDDPTRFMLVQVAKKAEDHVLRRNISSWIHEGAHINGVHYRFLGFTESQVKDGKLMFFREDERWSVKHLLSQLGNLDSVYLKSGYGKYSARLGLSFSSTVRSLDIPHQSTVEVPDLCAPDDSLHSDGCGMIRESFAVQVCTQHDLPSDTSVFQIRRGGIKGLLVRYPDNVFDQLCQGHGSGHPLIAYRPSMYKYAGGPTVLEINNINSPPGSARLNIQFIALLLTRGVSLQVFERLLQDQLDLIGSIMTDREKALAYIKGELDAAAQDTLTQSLYAMLLAQQNLSEPIVKQKLQRFKNMQYDTLRKKMNLRIPDSCHVFGVVDEEDILDPNEVYINLPHRTGVLVRDVIVARNPSYHPGDVRKLRAVDHPALRHHRNCIVFSQKAPHSVPDSIASGDLDGDLYFVTWEQSLLPPKDALPLNRALPATAAAQTNQSAAPATRQVSDMPRAAISTFMQLKFNRLLGTMSNEWLSSVDKTPELADSPYVQGLVPLIETALDIMKSGEDSDELEAQFRQLRNRNCATSSGEYRGPIQRLREMIPEAQREAIRLDGNQCDRALILRDEDPQLWEQYLTEAKTVMSRYNKALTEAIGLDNLDDEYSDHGPASRFDNRSRYADRVKEQYKESYFRGGDQKAQNEQRMRASVWYHYGYTENKESFSWLGERYLNMIKAWSSNGNKPPLFVGAVHQPVVSSSSRSPLVRMDTQETLVDELPSSQSAASGSRSQSMDVDTTISGEDSRLEHKASVPVSACPARRDEGIRLATESPPIRSGTCESANSVLVSVASNPKPRAPVAMRYDFLNSTCPVRHIWKLLGANRLWRGYICENCGIRVDEKKKDGYWVGHQIAVGVRRRQEDESGRPLPPRIPRGSPAEPPMPTEVGASPATPLKNAESTDTDTESEDDVMSIYESAEDDDAPISPLRSPSRFTEPEVPRRSTVGTTSSDAPSSLFGFAGVQRFPRLVTGVDISSLFGRSRQVSSRRTSTSGTTVPSDYRPPTSPLSGLLGLPSSPSNGSSSSETVGPPLSVLVSSNPLPKAPVATIVRRQCRGSVAHSWKVDWASGTHRRYKCLECGEIVKEQKKQTPQVWVTVLAR